jgi:flagellin-like hook-associated protein FlgL
MHKKYKKDLASKQHEIDELKENLLRLKNGEAYKGNKVASVNV